MKTVVISKDTLALIRGRATLPFSSTGKNLPDGRVEVSLAEETIERLSEINPDIDLAIQLLMARTSGAVN